MGNSVLCLTDENGHDRVFCVNVLYNFCINRCELPYPRKNLFLYAYNYCTESRYFLITSERSG